MTRYRVCPGCGHTITGYCPRCQPRGRANRSPSTQAQRGDGGRYERNRRLVLAGAPLCHWCHVRPATHADHLLPVSRGGTSELSNLVPACAPCNLSRQDNPDWRPV